MNSQVVAVLQPVNGMFLLAAHFSVGAILILEANGLEYESCMSNARNMAGVHTKANRILPPGASPLAKPSLV